MDLGAAVARACSKDGSGAGNRLQSKLQTGVAGFSWENLQRARVRILASFGIQGSFALLLGSEIAIVNFC